MGLQSCQLVGDCHILKTEDNRKAICMPDSYQGFSLILQALESLHYGPAGQFQKDLLISRLYIHFHQWSKDCKLKVKNYIHAYKLKNIIPIMIQIINIY